MVDIKISYCMVWHIILSYYAILYCITACTISGRQLSFDTLDMRSCANILNNMSMYNIILYHMTQYCIMKSYCIISNNIVLYDIQHTWLRLCIQACRVHQYQNMHHLCKFSKVMSSIYETWPSKGTCFKTWASYKNYNLLQHLKYVDKN